MDKQKQPGVTCENIILKEIFFKRNPRIFENFDHKIDFISTANLTEDKKHLEQELSININKNTPDSPFELSCSMLGFFSVIDDEPNMMLEKFSEAHAPAIIMPFLREMVSNITLRSGIKPLIIRPINVNALAKQAQNAQTEI